MDALNIGSRREVCWDEALMDIAEGVRVQLHKPEYRGSVLHCDMPWEGNCCYYGTVLEDADRFRLYYRGYHMDVDRDGDPIPDHITVCYAESKDGKTFARVNTGIVPFWGSTDNNILLEGDKEVSMDNFTVFADPNPACPPEERYKALCGARGQVLMYYKSADGIHFTKERVLVDDGAYDSLNVAFWNKTDKQYYLFYRGMHGEATDGKKWVEGTDMMHNKGVVRDVRLRKSKDFIHWDAPQMISFAPERDDTELYTNNIMQYYRAKHMFIGFPTRYIDRYEDEQNFRYLPDWEHRQKLINVWGRVGTAMTDAMIMTSRDGVTYRRTDEAYMTPGVEGGSDWYYGDCYLIYGMAQTASDRPGGPDEISLYMGLHCQAAVPVTLSRFATRLDGFFSWRCDYTPGKVVTKPVTFDGDRMELNFSTSAVGYVRIRLLDEAGEPIEGYDSGRLFGDSVARPVDFGAPLEALSGKNVRLEITMKDADLYSFRFFRPVAIT